MKNFIKNISGYAALYAIILGFNACEQSEVAPEANLSVQNIQEAHQTNYMNLNKTYTVDLMELNGSGVSGIAQWAMRLK